MFKYLILILGFIILIIIKTKTKQKFSDIPSEVMLREDNNEYKKKIHWWNKKPYLFFDQTRNKYTREDNYSILPLKFIRDEQKYNTYDCGPNMYQEKAINKESEKYNILADEDDLEGKQNIYETDIDNNISKVENEVKTDIFNDNPGIISQEKVYKNNTQYLLDYYNNNIINAENDDEKETSLTLQDYYKLQTLKKTVKDKTDRSKNDTQLETSNINTYRSATSNSEMNPVLKLNEQRSQLHEENNYYDLFGKPHTQQGYSDFAVSQGYNENGENVGTLPAKISTYKCKSCPIGSVQNYNFQLSDKQIDDIILANPDDEIPNSEGNDYETNKLNHPKVKVRNNKKYFIERGGTIYDPTIKKCIPCNYQNGCYMPYNNDGFPTKLRYQTQSCGLVDGEVKNRECANCKECKKGTEYISRFCGEGGGNQDTVCTPCAECDDDQFKIDGCNKQNTTQNSVCKNKSKCIGYPPYTGASITEPVIKTYMIDNGYKGGPRGYKGSNGTTDLSTTNNVDLKKKHEQYINTGYLGKDRKCAECQVCTYENNQIQIGGCSGVNDELDSICITIPDELSNLKQIAESIKPTEGSFIKLDYLIQDYIQKIYDYIQKNLDTKKGETLESITDDEIKDRIKDRIEELFVNLKDNTDIYNNIKEYVKVKNPHIDDTLLNQIVNKCILETTALGEDDNNLCKPELFSNMRNNDKKKNNNVVEGFTNTNQEFYSEADIKNLIEFPCTETKPGHFIDPANKGCSKKFDTNFIEFKKCKGTGQQPSEDSELLISEGTPFSDTVCGPCKCPDGFVGAHPKCNGTKEVEGCVQNKQCQNIDTNTTTDESIIGLKIKKDAGAEDIRLFTYDKPADYKDNINLNRCKVCDEECPPGSYQIEPCDPLRSSNIICKNHTTCDAETQITLQKGNSQQDTICKCIEGYEFQKDEFDLPIINAPCVKIKGKCWENPCHPNALCYDKFDDDGKFKEFICRCDIEDNWIETELKGVGSKGCLKISDQHSHDVSDSSDVITPAISNDYGKLLAVNPNALNIMSHTLGVKGSDKNPMFHSKLIGPHIHK